MKSDNNKPLYQFILFDLDNTLYPKEAGLMDIIGERIIQFMVQKVNIPADDATLMRRAYYQEYGTTLRGLINEHQVDPIEYLDFVLNVDPRDFFEASPPLSRMLQDISLRKVIFTNAGYAHCHRVLETLGVQHHFERIFDIQALDFLSKPDPRVYKQVLNALNVLGENCIMVEDNSRNLIPAKDLGMTTILIGDRQSIAVDYAVPTVFHVEKILRELLPNSLTR